MIAGVHRRGRAAAPGRHRACGRSPGCWTKMFSLLNSKTSRRRAGGRGGHRSPPPAPDAFGPKMARSLYKKSGSRGNGDSPPSPSPDNSAGHRSGRTLSGPAAATRLPPSIHVRRQRAAPRLPPGPPHHARPRGGHGCAGRCAGRTGFRAQSPHDDAPGPRECRDGLGGAVPHVRPGPPHAATSSSATSSPGRPRLRR